MLQDVVQQKNRQTDRQEDYHITITSIERLYKEQCPWYLVHTMGSRYSLPRVFFNVTIDVHTRWN